ncbi:hypothetical protein PVAND_003992 [Polypedilum vanderplanki]
MFRKLNLFKIYRTFNKRQLSLSIRCCNNFTEESKDFTHFGFETVKTDEKTEKVHQVFKDVAEKYDLMNDAMSMGIHRLWKDIFLERLYPTLGTKLLDVAGGTGDIAFRYINYINNLNKSNQDAYSKKSSVTILDINQHMLNVGMERAEKLGHISNETLDVEWVCGNAEELPLESDQFTAYTIAFGIRNVTHIDKALREAYRVLKPGGRFMCLEFSHIENNETLQWLYDQYSFQVIPPMGQILANQWQPYQYLVESIRKFPKKLEFKSMIEEAGFKQVTYENLTLGICAIHSGFKL